LYKLPDSTKVYVGHDYQPGGRELKFQTTIGEEKEKNIHLKNDTTKEAYVEFRTNRDKTLQAPNLLLQSIQININGGHLPPKEDNGISYLKIPINK
ncbi:MAG: MBL fold metallo-hydrolase, partial [Bacteriovoracales bacterium]